MKRKKIKVWNNEQVIEINTEEGCDAKVQDAEQGQRLDESNSSGAERWKDQEKNTHKRSICGPDNKDMLPAECEWRWCKKSLERVKTVSQIAKSKKRNKNAMVIKKFFGASVGRSSFSLFDISSDQYPPNHAHPHANKLS